jgi:pimeloyl-ACP methyl ester carboxylesterase
MARPLHATGTAGRIRMAAFVALAACCLAALAGCGASRDTDAGNGTVTAPDGVAIAYDTAGDGDVAVVLVHGWSCDRTYWDEQVAALSPRYRLVRIDLAGHGASGLGRQRYTMRAFGKDVAAVVDALDLGPTVLVGHSQGGAVCVEAARIVPDRVVGLIGVDTLMRPSFGLSREQIQAVLAPFQADFASQVEVFVAGMFVAETDTALAARITRDMAAAPPAVAISALSEYLGHDLAPALAGSDVPIRCLNAELWPADTAAWSDYAGGYEVETMSGVGHFLMLEQPAEFNRRLVAIIDNLAGGAGSR